MPPSKQKKEKEKRRGFNLVQTSRWWETNFGELLEIIIDIATLYPVLLPIKNNIWSIKVEVKG